MGANPGKITGGLHVRGTLSAYRVRLPPVGDAAFSADSPMASTKVVQRIHVHRADSSSTYAYTRTICMLTTVRRVMLRALGAWQWSMPSNSREHVAYNLVAYRGSESIQCLQQILRLYGSGTPKHIYWVTPSDPIGEAIYLDAGWSVYVVRTAATSGPAVSGTGSSCVLIADEYPRRGGIMTRHGIPVRYG